MKQNETSQPVGGLAIIAVTVMIPILLSFQRWQRKHHKLLKLSASETSPTDQTGKPHLPRRWSITSSTGSDLIEAAKTVILWSELRARENRYRETSRQRELLPSRQLVPIILIGTKQDKRQTVDATRRLQPRSRD